MPRDIFKVNRRCQQTGSTAGRMNLHRQYIDGPWKKGIVLDWHTVDSRLVGEDEFGNPLFDTKRTEIGELLYQFKYCSNQQALDQLLGIALNHLPRAKGRFGLIIPVPPSDPTRTVTGRIAARLADGLAARFSASALTKVRTTDEIKSVTDPQRRKELLDGAFAADSSQIRGRSILLVDDLYRSGATLEAATNAVYTQGCARTVYVFAVTRTRVNR